MNGASITARPGHAQHRPLQSPADGPPSSRGLGRRPLTAETGVRIPVAVLPLCRIVERSKGQLRCNARCNVARQGARTASGRRQRTSRWSARQQRSRRDIGRWRIPVASPSSARRSALLRPRSDPGDRSQDATNAVWSPARGRPVGSSISEPLAARRRCFSTAGGRASRRIGPGWNHSPCIRGPEAALEPCLVVAREVERGDHLERDGRTGWRVCQPGLASSPRLIFTCPPWMPWTRRSSVPLQVRVERRGGLAL
jgi:hypothetical protein